MLDYTEGADRKDDAEYKEGVLQWIPQPWEAAGFEDHEHWGPKVKTFRVELEKVKVKSMTQKKKGVWTVEFSDRAVVTMKEEWIESSGYQLWISALEKAKAQKTMDTSEVKEEEHSPEVLRLQQQLEAERVQRHELEQRLKEEAKERERQQSEELQVVHYKLKQLERGKEELQQQLMKRRTPSKRKWAQVIAQLVKEPDENKRKAIAKQLNLSGQDDGNEDSNEVEESKEASAPRTNRH